MPPIEAQRTLVKSPPELWAELSDPASLARHLGEFGEIRIARVEAETSVEWEADSATGTVELKPSGWGTKVTLTVTREAPEPVAVEPEPEPKPEPEPEPEPEPTPQARPKLFARVFRRWRRAQPAIEAEPEQPEAVPEEEEPPDLAAELAAELERVEEAMAEQDAALLSGVLDRLGAAHHRPFSRG
jgi:outer membrane biosynthesis protein TonB